jgi:hypothetical protein
MFLNIDHCFSRLFGFCCLLHEYTPAFNACSLCICRPIESAAAIVIVVMPDHQLFGRVVDITSILPPPLFLRWPCSTGPAPSISFELGYILLWNKPPPACTRVLYLDYCVCVRESERSVGVKHTIIRAFHSVCVALGQSSDVGKKHPCNR